MRYVITRLREAVGFARMFCNGDVILDRARTDCLMCDIPYRMTLCGT